MINMTDRYSIPYLITREKMLNVLIKIIKSQLKEDYNI